MSEFSDLVQRLVMGGADPNDLEKDFAEAVRATSMWEQWGDASWHENLVCSKCGSSLAGICHDGDADVGLFDFFNPLLHRNQPGVTQLPYREWLKTHSETGGI